MSSWKESTTLKFSLHTTLKLYPNLTTSSIFYNESELPHKPPTHWISPAPGCPTAGDKAGKFRVCCLHFHPCWSPRYSRMLWIHPLLLMPPSPLVWATLPHHGGCQQACRLLHGHVPQCDLLFHTTKPPGEARRHCVLSCGHPMLVLEHLWSHYLWVPKGNSPLAFCSLSGVPGLLPLPLHIHPMVLAWSRGLRMLASYFCLPCSPTLMKSTGSIATWCRFSAEHLAIFSCVTLDKLLNFSVPQFLSFSVKQ